jgi:diacylglycerol kinase family enzyme
MRRPAKLFLWDARCLKKPKSMKIALIANSRASGIYKNKLMPDLERKLKQHKIGFDLLRTQYHGHATELVTKERDIRRIRIFIIFF